MKKTNKTIKKQFKPDYTLDFSNIHDYTDLVIALTEARVKAGKTLDMADLNAYTKACVDYTVAAIPPKLKIIYIDCEDCKKPWYKRFWNWLTRKK